MPARGFGYVTAQAARPASHTRRQPRTRPRPAGQPATERAYVNPLAGWEAFCLAQRRRHSQKLLRAERRLRRAIQRAIESEGTDVQFVESRKG